MEVGCRGEGLSRDGCRESLQPSNAHGPRAVVGNRLHAVHGVTLFVEIRQREETGRCWRTGDGGQAAGEGRGKSSVL